MSRGTGLCHQPLDNLLWVYLFINLILCGILIVFAILWSCWRILKQCCCSSPTSTPRIRPSSPTRTKTKWVLTWLPVWVEVDWIILSLNYIFLWNIIFNINIYLICFYLAVHEITFNLISILYLRSCRTFIH